MSESSDLPSLPPRPETGHKGTFGSVLIIGGCTDDDQMMVGAPALTAMAALRTGCGLVRIAAPQPILPAVLSLASSATGIPISLENEREFASSHAAQVLAPHIERSECLAVGPGWGVGEQRQQWLIWLLSQEETPIVLDADGLNNLAQVREFASDLRAPLVMTPHPGELRRLVAALAMPELSNDPSQGEHQDAAVQLAARLGCVVVLKSATTIITDGVNVHTHRAPNPVLATGGTGDVLTGMIASLIAQYWSDSSESRCTEHELSLVDLARWAVYIHAQAAQRWADQHGSGGMFAIELCDQIPLIMNQIRSSNSSERA